MAKWGMGQVVHICYTGGIEGEEPVDMMMDEPLAVILGAGRIPIGVEKELFDMEVGEHRRIVVTPNYGYGERDERKCYWQPRTLIPNGYQWHTGDVLLYTDKETGEAAPVWVVDEREDVLKVDHNHPFAGKTLVYEVDFVSGPKL